MVGAEQSYRAAIEVEPRHANALRFLSAKRPDDLPSRAPALLQPSTAGMDAIGAAGGRERRGDCGWRYALLPQRRFANLKLLTEFCGRQGRPR